MVAWLQITSGESGSNLVGSTLISSTSAMLTDWKQLIYNIQ